MFFRTALFILCVPAFLAFADVESQNYSMGEAPAWVQPCAFSLDDVPVKPSQANYQYLIVDIQRNWEEKTKYVHEAVKVLSQWGAQDISKVEIGFNPTYVNVVVHMARVFRDGEWGDRLEGAKLKIVQRAKELELGIFRGDLTLICFLEDIREGDIVEYAYSRIGEPILSASKLVETILLQNSFSIEKIRYRLLGHRDLPLQIKPFNTDVQPTVSDVSDYLREWVWEVKETTPNASEDHEPDWYDSSAHIHLSLFESWGDVARQVYPLYTLPADFEESIPSEMRALIEKWKGSAQSKSELALMAIRFVQDKVRYLSISEGIKGWQPNDPSFTFLRRFGDCKSKSFLLHALLKLLDIPSTPALVHTSMGKKVAELLPMPYFANHVVLQLEVDGMPYWVDSTINLQGGSLETNHFPNYAWALLISDKTEGLTETPQEVCKNPMEIHTSYTLESEETACLKIQSTSYGAGADLRRRGLKNKGLKYFAKDHLANIQSVYGWVDVTAPMEVIDDRENNVLTRIMSYRILTEDVTSGKFMEVYSYILSLYLTERVNPMRDSPYEIDYPLWVREHIHLENPFMDLEESEEEYVQNNDLLLYTLACRAKGSTMDYDIELRHLQDHIPPSAFRDYWNLVNDIRRNSPKAIRIAPPAEEAEKL